MYKVRARVLDGLESLIFLSMGPTPAVLVLWKDPVVYNFGSECSSRVKSSVPVNSCVGGPLTIYNWPHFFVAQEHPNNFRWGEVS